MRIVADLHLHSRYSRATSPRMDLDGMSNAARKKGVNLLGTADFTHPEWRKELEKLEEDGEFYYYNGVHFIPSVEISLIYKKSGRLRKVHVVIIARDLETADMVSSFLSTKGRLDYDGRPIFGMSLEELVSGIGEMDIEVFPAHAWTPWFSIFGANSGFDSPDEALPEWKSVFHALETGLSSDPEMNGMVSWLDSLNLVSNSDAHSPERIGREANVFEWNGWKWSRLLASIRKGEGFLYTIEVDPAFGKYHFDGHRNCNVSVDPRKETSIICPKCGKPLTIGVLHRVIDLADRKQPEIKRPYRTLLPLDELFAAVFNTSPKTQKVKKLMEKAYSIGNELHVLLEADQDELESAFGEQLASKIIQDREGRIKIIPGYDGQYGRPVLSGLFDFA